MLQVSEPVPGLADWNQIDVTGVLTTLSDGQRALVCPSAIYRRDSENGMPTILMPKSYTSDGSPEMWPWRTLVYPQ